MRKDETIKALKKILNSEIPVNSYVLSYRDIEAIQNVVDIVKEQTQIIRNHQRTIKVLELKLKEKRKNDNTSSQNRLMRIQYESEIALKDEQIDELVHKIKLLRKHKEE